MPLEKWKISCLFSIEFLLKFLSQDLYNFGFLRSMNNEGFNF